MRDSGRILRIVAWLSLISWPTTSCGTPSECAPGTVLGEIGDAGSGVTLAEVKTLVARIRSAGGSVSEGDALIDLLWQESERQRLGLPGAADAQFSRRKVALGHHKRLSTGATKRLRDSTHSVPDGATLTACGEGLLKTNASGPRNLTP